MSSGLELVGSSLRIRGIVSQSQRPSHHHRPFLCRLDLSLDYFMQLEKLPAKKALAISGKSPWRLIGSGVTFISPPTRVGPADPAGTLPLSLLARFV